MPFRITKKNVKKGLKKDEPNTSEESIKTIRTIRKQYEAIENYSEILVFDKSDGKWKIVPASQKDKYL
jgi:hypothetical protein